MSKSITVEDGEMLLKYIHEGNEVLNNMIKDAQETYDKSLKKMKETGYSIFNDPKYRLSNPRRCMKTGQLVSCPSMDVDVCTSDLLTLSEDDLLKELFGSK